VTSDEHLTFKDDDVSKIESPPGGQNLEISQFCVTEKVYFHFQLAKEVPIPIR